MKLSSIPGTALLGLFFNQAKIYPKWLFIVLLSMLISIIYISSAPFIYKMIFDNLIERPDLSFLWLPMAAILTMFVTQATIGIGEDWVLSRLTINITHDIKKTLFEAMYGDRHLSSTHKKMLFSESLPAIENGITYMAPIFIKNGAIAIVCSILLIQIQWLLALLTFGLMLCSSWLPYFFNRRAKRHNEAAALFPSRQASVIRDYLIAPTLTWVYQLTPFWINHYLRELQFQYNQQQKMVFHQFLVSRATNFSINGVLILLVMIGVIMTIGFAHFTVGSLMAFMTMLLNLSNALEKITTIFPILNKIETHIDAYQGINFDASRSTPDHTKLVNQPQNCHIQANDLCFSYRSGQTLIKNINFDIEPGSSWAIVGQSGSGKSTLIGLLLGQLKAQHGKLLVDNQSLQSTELSSYHEQIGLVEQDIPIFNMSVADNMKIGRFNATHDEIVTAAKQAEIHDMIMELPDQYDTFLDPDKLTLSGGQCQRIALARALIRHPKILILDEATSALDIKIETQIMASIRKIRQENPMTLIFVTHRLTHVVNMDGIILMKNGRIDAMGKHQDLIQHHQSYQALWNAQNSIQIDTHHEISIDLNVLKKIRLFSDLNQQQLTSLSQLFVLKKWNAQEQIIHLGQSSDHMYLIAEGIVDIYKSKQATADAKQAVLTTGNHFGEISMLFNQPAIASVITRSPCQLLCLNQKNLGEFMRALPERQQQHLSAMAHERFHQTLDGDVK